MRVREIIEFSPDEQCWRQERTEGCVKDEGRGFGAWEPGSLSGPLFVLVESLRLEVWMDTDEAIKDGDGSRGARKIGNKI